MPVQNRSQYPLRVATPKKARGFRVMPAIAGASVFLIGGFFLIPKIITIEVLREQSKPIPVAVAAPFPVSVDANTKSIVPNPEADALFANNASQLAAAADEVSYIFDWIASVIGNTALYQSLASADGHIITVRAGMRKEQILSQLTSALNWTPDQQQQFLVAEQAQTPGIPDGTFTAGTYVVNSTMTPQNVAALMSLAFNKSILLHYSTTTQQHVPLATALTVASLIEREAKDTNDMRQISGIIWNRLFSGMNLQIDATLQYAKGQNQKSGWWWSTVVPKDKYVKSPYNTYLHPGLPPGPIANPSVAAVLAALNPVDTDCIFYFHDKNGNFHCTKTYADHVKMLKQYYGQGK